MNDGRVVEAARWAVRILVRRPHAYKFKREHTQAPIPGLVVLDEQGGWLRGVPLPSENAVEAIVQALRR